MHVPRRKRGRYASIASRDGVWESLARGALALSDRDRVVEINVLDAVQ